MVPVDSTGTSTPSRKRGVTLRLARTLAVGLMAAAAIGAIAVTVVSLFARQWWVADVLTNFRVQLVWVLALCAVGLLLLRAPRWAALACAGAAFNMAFVIVALLPVADASTAAAGHLRVLMSNVRTSNANHQAVIDHVEREQPDVVVLLEVDETWLRGLAPLAEIYPFQATVPRSDNFGLAIFSRLPLEGTDLYALGTDTLPAIVTHVMAPTGPLSLIAGHPIPPMNLQQVAHRDATIRALAALARQQPRPVVLCADLNTGPWSPAFADLLAVSGLVDTRRGQGVLPTWSARWPPVPAIPIDHCLVSPEIGVDDVRVGPNVGSDHLPLTVDLAVPGR